MEIEAQLQQRVAQGLSELYGVKVPFSEIQVQETRKEFEGEFTVVTFPLTRYSKKSPQDTADEIGVYLQNNVDEVAFFNVVKGFLNLSMGDTFWLEAFNNFSSDWQHVQSVKTHMVEYSSPNTNKPLHLGHIRNILLGYSISKILGALGHNVIKANLINDRGIHVCKSMLAWQKFGNGETPATSGMKGDHLVGKYYVEFDKRYKAQINELVKGGMSQEEAEKNTPILKEAQNMLQKWEAGDTEVIETWKMMNNWVYAGFDQTYQVLGVDFDMLYYESNTYILGKEIVNEGLSQGAFYKKDDGSVWVDLTDEGLDHKLLLRSDGTSVYITQDLGTAQQRFDENALDSLIYVVGNEQEYHFKVLRLIFKKLGRKWYDSLIHLSYGMVELPSGKMKSREGTVVDADDLIAEMIEQASVTTRELGKISELPAENVESLYSQIGLAALKFYILKTDPRKQMLFNPEESIDLHGFTGPFIQYTYTRIRSILRKSQLENYDWVYNKDKLKEYSIMAEEKQLIMLLGKKDNILMEAASALSPALIANYIYEVAKTYNRFYHEHSVLNEPNVDIRLFRLNLSSKTSEVIKNSMALLGIEMPERM